MSVEDTRYTYLFAAANAAFTCNGSRRYREARWLEVDAASLAYDLAVAEAHQPLRQQQPIGAVTPKEVMPPTSTTGQRADDAGARGAGIDPTNGTDRLPSPAAAPTMDKNEAPIR